LLVRPSIGQAFAHDASGQCLGARLVVNAKGGAVVVAEIKFRETTVQVLLGAVLVKPRIPRLNTLK
jgi:hypothetical protein